MRYVYLFGTIGFMAVGQVLFKFLAMRGGGVSKMLLSPAFVGTSAIYAAAAIMWILALREFPLTVAYPAQSLAIVAVVLAGSVFFHETLTPLHLLGVGAIVGGLVMIGLGHR